MTMYAITMLEAVKGSHNANRIDALISNLTNTLNGLMQGENGNRKVILDTINSLKKEKD